jgi:hypothetical protein
VDKAEFLPSLTFDEGGGILMDEGMAGPAVFEERRGKELRTIVFFLAIALISISAGCSKEREILAVVGGKKIYLDDFQKEVSRIPPFYLAALEKEKEGKRKLLDQWITREILLKEAKRKGIGRRPDIKDRFKEIEVIAKRQKENILVDALIDDEVMGKAKTDDISARRFYESRKSEFGGKPFEEVKEEVKNRMRSQRYEEWINGLRSKTRIVVNEKALEKLVLVPKPSKERKR